MGGITKFRIFILLIIFLAIYFGRKAFGPAPVTQSTGDSGTAIQSVPNMAANPDIIVQTIYAGDEENFTMFLNMNKLHVNDLLNGSPPLVHAINSEKVGIIKILISRGADVNLPGSNGKRPLTLAREKNNMVIYQLLQNASASESMDSADKTPDFDLMKKFIEACSSDRTRNVAYHIAAIDQLSPNYRDESGHTPLYFALQNLDLETEKFLLQHGADPNAPFSFDDPTPVYFIPVQKSKIYFPVLEKMIQELVRYNLNFMLRDKEGKAVVYVAKQNKWVTGEKTLRDAGAPDTESPPIGTPTPDYSTQRIEYRTGSEGEPVSSNSPDGDN